MNATASDQPQALIVPLLGGDDESVAVSGSMMAPTITAPPTWEGQRVAIGRVRAEAPTRLRRLRRLSWKRWRSTGVGSKYQELGVALVDSLLEARCFRVWQIGRDQELTVSKRLVLRG